MLQNVLETAVQTQTSHTITKWTVELSYKIYSQLEVPNWAPWLAASETSLAGRAQTFPDGQLLISDPESGNLIASISTNQIMWDGNPDTIPTWDEVAGDPTTYEQTYTPEGNTLVLMSANVNPKYQGKGFGRILIKEVMNVATTIGSIDHVIGSFRPTGYGDYKSANPASFLPFDQYVTLPAPEDKTRPIDQHINWEPWGGTVPYDPWFRNLARNGMVPLKVDHNAMMVPLTAEDVVFFQNKYNPNKWQHTESGILSGEVGMITQLDDGSYQYTESNLWGILPYSRDTNE